MSKKDLNQDKDEIIENGKDFEQSSGDENKVVKFREFVQNKSQLISWISIGAILLVAGIFFAKNYLEKSSESKRENAAVSLSRILPYYEAPDFKTALFGEKSATIRNQKIIGLIDIVKEYKSTNIGKVAALYAGNSYLAVGKASEAVGYFEIAGDSPSKLVIMGSYAGLGSCNEYMKKFDEAAEFYQKAAELSVSEQTKSRYLYYAASMFEKSGKKPEAEKIYRSIIDEDQMSEFANYSKAGLTRLGMIIE